MKCKNNKQHDFQYNRKNFKYECVECNVKYDKDIHSLKDPVDESKGKKATG